MLLYGYTLTALMQKQPDYHIIRDTFFHDLLRSSQGKKTSIPFLKNPLPQKNLVNSGEIFQIFVIGGTNGILAKMQYEKDASKILHKQNISLASRFETNEEFFMFILEQLDSETKVLGINFAFTLSPILTKNDIVDGILLGGDKKSHNFITKQTKPFGEQIADFLAGKGRNVTVTLANDVVCLLLAGVNNKSNKSKTAAGVLGTGYNLSFFLDDKTLINTQASDFTNYELTETAKDIDDQSENKGHQVYAKEVAGGYLYEHFNLLRAERGIKEAVSSTSELNSLAEKDHGPASQLANELLERSASFVAAQLAGFYLFKQKPSQLTFVMEGSLFWKGYHYQTHLKKRLEQLGIPQDTILFTKINNSEIIGGSKLVTSI